MSMSFRTKLAIGSALFLVIGSCLLTACGGSETGGLDEGPGMMYFYAEW